MSSEEKRPIVIKRIKKISAGAHGGAWKIAYADFVTAMMAFFLLMWLLGSTTKGDLNGIAEYFKTPLKVAMLGGDGSGDATSIIKGGGQDITKTAGQVKNGEVEQIKKKITLKAATEELMRMEKLKELDKLKELKKNIENAINENPKLQQYKSQILLDITSEGLRIQIVDEKNRPMFKIGRSELEPYTKDILQEIGRTMNAVPNKVSLSGHTDGHPYSSNDKKGFSNWDLSADRANASRRELIAGGMDEAKVVRVVGMSSAVLFDKTDPFNPINRRISIIVMNKKAEEAAQHDGGVVELDAESGGASGVSNASAPGTPVVASVANSAPQAELQTSPAAH